jgi:hypothetical protein
MIPGLVAGDHFFDRLLPLFLPAPAAGHNAPGPCENFRRQFG